ncbi:MAG: stage V sporulation protein AA [Hungatella sp.]|nr:stage V sporulation protein AA [Hungatella sp.]
MGKSLYLKLNQISEVHEKDVYLKDIATLYSDDSAVLNKCLALRVKKISSDRDHRYVGSVLDVIRLISETDPSIQVENLGEQDFIIDYQKPKSPKLVWEWIKTGFVCIICFCGAAFAIMTFNNDASVTDVFREVYRMVLGYEAGEFTVLELSYSVGLALGVILFFNHFCAWKVNTDPTPLEVEMRLYEDNISKTVIQNDGRKESGIDVS